MLCSYISQIFSRYISVIIRIGQGIKLSLIKNKYAISVVVTYGYLTDCFFPYSILIPSGCYHRYNRTAGKFTIIFLNVNIIGLKVFILQKFLRLQLHRSNLKRY